MGLGPLAPRRLQAYVAAVPPTPPRLFPSLAHLSSGPPGTGSASAQGPDSFRGAPGGPSGDLSTHSRRPSPGSPGRRSLRGFFPPCSPRPRSSAPSAGRPSCSSRPRRSGAGPAHPRPDAPGAHGPASLPPGPAPSPRAGGTLQRRLSSPSRLTPRPLSTPLPGRPPPRRPAAWGRPPFINPRGTAGSSSPHLRPAPPTARDGRGSRRHFGRGQGGGAADTFHAEH